MIYRTKRKIVDIEIGCPGCLAEEYTLKQLQTAYDDASDLQKEALYEAYSRTGTVTDGSVTISMVGDPIRYDAIRDLNIELNLLLEAIQIKWDEVRMACTHDEAPVPVLVPIQPTTTVN